MFAQYIGCFVLSLLMVAGCKRGNKQDTTSKNGDKPAAAVTGPIATEENITLDSGELKKFMGGFRERQEFGPSITRFYQNTQYHAVWTDGSKPTAQAQALVERMSKADEDGIPTGRYRLKQMRELLNAEGENKLKERDLLFTSEFFKFAADMLEGVTRREKEDLGWFVPLAPIKYDSVLRLVLEDKSANALARLEPTAPAYGQLKKLLALYQAVDKKGGWPTVPEIKKMKTGDTSIHVVKLRERLALSGDLSEGGSNFYNPRVFDRALELSVRAFQTRHGLNPDGVVAGKTLAALNVPVKERILQVKVNLERWRMLPQNLGDNYLLVNVPEFRLHIMENNKEAFNMRVIVGKEFKSTPVFSDRLENVVFSPYWNVPKSIIAEEIVPAMQRNPDFLYKNNMETMYGFGKQAVEVKPWNVPWSKIDEENWQYWVRQRPGGENPLGLVKFLFPNNHNVYLHDTPNDYLFQQVRRDYSHGCIRLEEPEKLANYVLRDQAATWTPQAIHDAMNSGKELWVKVKPMPVYILYFTTWMDESGTIQVRDDLYGLDRTQAAYL